MTTSPGPQEQPDVRARGGHAAAASGCVTPTEPCDPLAPPPLPCTHTDLLAPSPGSFHLFTDLLLLADACVPMPFFAVEGPRLERPASIPNGASGRRPEGQGRAGMHTFAYRGSSLAHASVLGLRLDMLTWRRALYEHAACAHAVYGSLTQYASV